MYLLTWLQCSIDDNDSALLCKKHKQKNNEILQKQRKRMQNNGEV